MPAPPDLPPGDADRRCYIRSKEQPPANLPVPCSWTSSLWYGTQRNGSPHSVMHRLIFLWIFLCQPVLKCSALCLWTLLSRVIPKFQSLELNESLMDFLFLPGRTFNQCCTSVIVFISIFSPEHFVDICHFPPTSFLALGYVWISDGKNILKNTQPACYRWWTEVGNVAWWENIYLYNVHEVLGLIPSTRAKKKPEKTVTDFIHVSNYWGHSVGRNIENSEYRQASRSLEPKRRLEPPDG